MGHRINQWIQRLLVPVAVIAAVALRPLGLGVGYTLAVLLPIIGALLLLMIVADPGPKARTFVDGLKNRLH